MKELLNKLPPDPGVYLMKDGRGAILYIGKAKNLKVRVKQYFVPGRDGREMIPYLTSKVVDIETIVVPNEREALLLENTLIKKHKPNYNVLLKDDKTFISISISKEKKWPAIRIERLIGPPDEKKHHFGPFTSAYAARQTVNLMHKLFPLRQCSDNELASRKRPCILHGIKRCIAPCVDLCSHEEYMQHVERAISFLKGQDKELLQEMYAEMDAASEALEFERAQAILHTIRQIERTIAAQSSLVQSAKKDCDVFGIYRSGKAFSLVKLIFREGRLIGAEPYYFRDIVSDDDEMWENFLLQHYLSKETLPKEIILPMELKQGKLLGEMIGVPLFTPAKGTKMQLLEMAQKNAMLAFQEASKEEVLISLQEALSLEETPIHIECIDTSNISGDDAVAAVISYYEGVYDKKRTRLFSIQSSGDDYNAMKESLKRHYKKGKEQNTLPDLLVLDGGKGQRNLALEVLKELDIVTIEVIALAKQESLHTKGITQEKVFRPGKQDPVLLPLYSAELQLLQRIRDEAHRVAIEYHKKVRSKRVVRSVLESIPGIGPKKKKALLAHFKSLKNVKKATREELEAVTELTKTDIDNILALD